MRLRTPTIELLAREFAESVAAGDLEAAEGWLATAQAVSARSDRGLRSGTTRRWGSAVAKPRLLGRS